MSLASRLSYFKGASGRPLYPYVGRGLVMAFDGEWNSGLGIHDPNARAWSNLAGGVFPDMVPVGQDFSFTGKTFRIDRSITTCAVCDHDISDIAYSGDYTVEVVAKRDTFPVNGNSYQSFIAFTDDPTTNRNRSLILDARHANYDLPQGTKEGFSAFQYRTRGWPGSDGYVLHPVNTSRFHRYSFTARGSVCELTLDDLGVVHKATGNYTAGTVKLFLNGYFYNWSGNSDMGIDWCSVRVYDRALTASEAMSNYKIDEARFSITRDTSFVSTV